MVRAVEVETVTRIDARLWHKHFAKKLKGLK